MEEKLTSRPFPPGLLLGAGLLILFTLSVIVFGRTTGVGVVRMQTGVVVDSRALRFENRPGGVIAVFDDSTGEVIDVVSPIDGRGFVDVAVRAMNFERERLGGKGPLVYHLKRWEDGRLMLEDPATGHRLYLGAFGASNREAFAQLLTVKRETSRDKTP